MCSTGRRRIGNYWPTTLFDLKLNISPSPDFRRDSDVVAPYEKWEYFDPRVRQIEQDRNYAMNKTKKVRSAMQLPFDLIDIFYSIPKVAWFVSNCSARNNRLQFAHELSKYIQVDIYGACGTLKCSRTTADKCFDILDRDYKFYLAFENSNCRDYITEKFFVNGLSRTTLPIVVSFRELFGKASNLTSLFL